MLCKCSGKYIDIYFILKITFLSEVTDSHTCIIGCKRISLLDNNFLSDFLLEVI